jgi:hypothetical protein
MEGAETMSIFAKLFGRKKTRHATATDRSKDDFGDKMAFCMVIEDTFALQNRKILVGNIQSGSTTKGDKIECHTQSGTFLATIDKLEAFGKSIDQAHVGQHVGISLCNCPKEKVSSIDRGDVLCTAPEEISQPEHDASSVISFDTSQSIQPYALPAAEELIPENNPSEEIPTVPRDDYPDRVGTSYVVISKESVLQKDVSALLNFVDQVTLPQIRSGDANYSRIVLTIGGYDDDARPLWDIPEVVDWFREVHTKHPYMPLLLSPGSIQVYFRVLGPIAHGIIPREFQHENSLKGLLLHSFQGRNAYFSRVLGSDYERCQAVLNEADKEVGNAVVKLAKGIEEPL